MTQISQHIAPKHGLMSARNPRSPFPRWSSVVG